MKANTEKVVVDWLKSTGKVAISANDLTSLQKELSDTKASAEADTKKQVAQVAGTLKAQYENDIRFIQSENKSVAAENTAKLNALVQNEKNLQEQVDKLYKQLDAERAASIERAKAASVGSINVGESNRK